MNAGKVVDIKAALAAGLGAPVGAIRAEIHLIEPHCAHLASSFSVSLFETVLAAGAREPILAVLATSGLQFERTPPLA